MAADAGLESFASYAAARGLTLEPGAHLPRTTPLLAEGELRSVDAVMSGWLATYLEAQMALITREETTTDGDGRRPRATPISRSPSRTCRRPSASSHGFSAGGSRRGLLGRAAEALVHGNERLDLESAELDQRYRIYASPERDDVWVHELFSPSFIVFLLEQAPRGFAFEYVEGTLCVSLVGRRTLAEDIDGLRDATVELVGRMRAEIRESLGRAQGRFSPTPPGYSDPLKG